MIADTRKEKEERMYFFSRSSRFYAAKSNSVGQKSRSFLRIDIQTSTLSRENRSNQNKLKSD